MQTERFIPELYMKRANGTWQEAVMDIAVTWPLASWISHIVLPIIEAQRREQARQHDTPTQQSTAGTAAGLKQWPSKSVGECCQKPSRRSGAWLSRARLGADGMLAAPRAYMRMAFRDSWNGRP